jgi:hypothetical protein
MLQMIYRWSWFSLLTEYKRKHVTSDDGILKCKNDHEISNEHENNYLKNFLDSIVCTIRHCHVQRLCNTTQDQTKQIYFTFIHVNRNTATLVCMSKVVAYYSVRLYGCFYFYMKYVRGVLRGFNISLYIAKAI